MSDRLLRLRVFLADWLIPVVIGLVLLAALGGWLTYTTHADPGVEQEEHVTTWSTSAGFDHAATVQADTQPFPEGEVVTDRPAYYDIVMPELDGNFTYTHTGDGELDTEIELEYVVREFEQRRDEENVTLWRMTAPLANESVTLTSGDTTTIEFTVDVNETIQRIETIEEELGGSPGTTQATIKANVGGEGTINGESVEIAETHEFVIEPGNPTYAVTDQGSEEEYSHTETETVQATYGPLRRFGSVGLLGGSVLALLVLGVGYVREEIEPAPERRRELAHRQTRTEFDDWITTGTLTPSLLDRNTVEVDSLEGLVDVAIDSDQRVIEDEDRDAYFVVDETVLYRYKPHRRHRFGSLSRKSSDADGDSETEREVVLEEHSSSIESTTDSTDGESKDDPE